MPIFLIKNKFFLSIFFWLTNFFFLIVGYFYFKNFNFETLDQINNLVILKTILLIFLFSLLRALRLKNIFNILNTKLSFYKYFYISTVSQSYGLLTPARLGEIYFVQFLKSNDKKKKFFIFLISKLFEFILLLSLFFFLLLSLFELIKINNHFYYFLTLFFFLFISNFIIFKFIKLLFYKYKIIQVFIDKNFFDKACNQYFRINLYSTASWVLLFYSVYYLNSAFLNINNFYSYSFLNQASISLPISFFGIGVRDFLFSFIDTNNLSLLISFSFIYVYFLMISLGFLIFFYNFLLNLFFIKK